MLGRQRDATAKRQCRYHFFENILPILNGGPTKSDIIE